MWGVFIANEVFGISLIYANKICRIFWTETDQCYLLSHVYNTKLTMFVKFQSN